MLTKKIASVLVGLLLTKLCLAFSPGVDYQVLSLNPIPAAMVGQKPGEIKVVEFFSYACPWCFKLDPALTAWEKTLPANVTLTRVPVVFQSQWAMFTRVFYVATELHVEKKLHKNIFDAVQASYPEDPSAATPFSILKAVDFSTDQGIRDYFIAQGINPIAINAVLNNPTRLDRDITQASDLAKALLIAEIPSVVVNGRYLVSNRYSGGDNVKFIKTLNYLLTLK